MTDQQLFAPSAATSDSGNDVTAVMGRRIFAWVLDLLIFIGIAVALFAAQAEYVDLSDYSGALGDACPALQDQYGDLASSCFEVGDRAYITTGSESLLQTGASFAYLAFFVVMQGLVGASPGKLVVGLRVVKADGSRAGVGRSLVRTLAWIIDGAPWFAPLVGFIVGLTSTGHRRVGDMIASTHVVGRKNVGAPVTTSAMAAPAGQQAWGAAPPPMAPPAGPSNWQASPSPTPPAAAPGPWTSTAPSASAETPSSDSSSGEPLSPEPLSPDPTPPSAAGPPPLPSMPAEAASPDIDDTPAAGAQPEAAAPSRESSTPADEAAPDVAADPDWYRGPEADPTDTSFESGSGEAPSTEPDVAAPDTNEPYTWTPTDPATEWSPPTTPTADIDTGDNASPTAGPAGFVAPGADAPVDRPPTQQPPGSTGSAQQPLPPPQWDQARDTYIQWDPNQQSWLQWDAAANRWKIIDT